MMGRRPPARVARRLRVAPIDEATAAAALAGLRGKPAHGHAPPKAGALALKILKPIMKDEGLTLGELKRRWPEIVGEKLAKLTAPEKLTHAPQGSTLTVSAASSAAPFVQHQERLILDRCALAGGRIVKLAIKQVSAARPMGNVRTLTRVLSAEEERALSQGLAQVEDNRLKDALAKLGRAVATRA